MCVRFKCNWEVMSPTLFQVSCSVHEKSPVKPYFLFEQVYQKSFSKTTRLISSESTVTSSSSSEDGFKGSVMMSASS